MTLERIRGIKLARSGSERRTSGSELELFYAFGLCRRTLFARETCFGALLPFSSLSRAEGTFDNVAMMERWE